MISDSGRVTRMVRRIFNVHPKEEMALVWSGLYVFSLFLAYYVLRPIREELGVAGGVKNLPWLFTGTLVSMLVVNPLFSYAVRQWKPEKFIAITYRFFMMNLLIFIVLLEMASTEQHVWIGRAFFIWVSVFNLFIVSVFWSFIVDIFNADQGKRLFGYLAAGATIGSIVGSALTSGLVKIMGQHWLLLVSILLLEVAVFASKNLSGNIQKSTKADNPHKIIGGNIFAGMLHSFRSPYLLGITFFIFIYTITSTFLYFEQATLAEANFQNRLERTAFFAEIDLWVNGFTLIFQIFLTGRVMGRLGIIVMLCILPIISIAGFASLASYPIIGVLVIVQVVRRVSNFAFANPAREILFTHVSREDRYKAKNFIDTVVYRSGDQIGSWTYAGLIGLEISMTGISIVAIPLSAVWLGIAFWLGRQQKKQEGMNL